MSRDGSVEFRWGDGDLHRFRLGIGELRALQEKLGTSPYDVLDRLMRQRPMVDEPREVIRHGLIGGGLPPAEAAKAVERWCDPPPHAKSIAPAVIVLSAALNGIPDEEPGKSEGTEAAPPPPPPEA